MEETEARAIIDRSMADKYEGLAAALSGRTDPGAAELAASLEKSAQKLRNPNKLASRAGAGRTSPTLMDS